MVRGSHPVHIVSKHVNKPGSNVASYSVTALFLPLCAACKSAFILCEKASSPVPEMTFALRSAFLLPPPPRLCGFEPFFDPRGDQYMYSRILNCDYEFVSPWWDEVSLNAKDLVSSHCSLPLQKLFLFDAERKQTFWGSR